MKGVKYNFNHMISVSTLNKELNKMEVEHAKKSNVVVTDQGIAILCVSKSFYLLSCN